MRSSQFSETTALRRVAAGATAAVAVSLAVSGCSGPSFIELDMSASQDHIGFLVGDPITGSVSDAHGTVKVSLIPAPLSTAVVGATQDPLELADPSTAMKRDQAIECTVEDDEAYTCPTTLEGRTLTLGRYVIEVRDYDTDYGNPDADLPADRVGVGTELIPVVLTDADGYDPYGGILPHEIDNSRTQPRDAYAIAEAGTATVTNLDGWKPGTTVTVHLLDGEGATLGRLTSTIDANGHGEVTIPALSPGPDYQVVLTDEVWAHAQFLLVDG